MIRDGKLTRLERENIESKVRRESLSVLEEVDETVLEADGHLSEGEISDSDGDWAVDEREIGSDKEGADFAVEVGPEEVTDGESVDDDSSEESDEDDDDDDGATVVEMPILAGQVVVQRLDVWCDGDVVEPVDCVREEVLSKLREVFFAKTTVKVPSLKTRNQLAVKEQVGLVNGVAGNVAKECRTLSDVNRLLYACSVVVADRLGLLKERKAGRKEKADPWWKRRIEKNIGVEERSESS